MKEIIVGRRFDVTDDFKQKVEKKLLKLDKFFDEQAVANVTMRAERNKEILEITITYKGTMFRSEVAEEKIPAALDKSIDIIERQIRKNKTRLEKRLKTGSVESLVEEFKDVPEDEIKITRVKKFDVRLMTAEEAVMQMNLLGHSFFLYRDAESGEFNVVYKKKNDEYGVIEPIE